MSDKNVTNSGDNKSFQYWFFYVTNFGENFGDLKKLVIFLVKKIQFTKIFTKIGDNFGENALENEFPILPRQSGPRNWLRDLE